MLAPLIAAPTVPQYEAFEITLSGSPVANPYLSYRLWAEFRGPQNKNFSLEGFWDGGQTWKIRVAFEEPGEWSYLTHSDDPLLDGHGGVIECITGISKGFIRRHGRHFYYADGTPFFRMGDTCWRIFRSKNAPYESRFVPYINARAEQGFNFVLGVIHTVGDPSINEGGSLWFNDTDLNQLQPGYFQWVDKRIDYMLRSGIVPGLVFVWAQRFKEFYQPPYNRDTFSRFRRYIVARYAAYNVFWILAGEYSEEIAPAEYDYHARAIRFGNQNPADGLLDCGDPYGHPLSIHPSGQESCSQHISLFDDWLGYITQQMYGTPDFLYQQIAADSFTNLPVCNDEFGYEGPTTPGDPYYYFNNQSGEETRRDAWAILCAGGYFTWGNIYTYTGKELILRVDKLYSDGAEYMRLLGEYVRTSLPFHEMTPKPACILSGEAFCLAKEGDRYLIYVSTSNAVTFKLHAETGRYRATWFDPETGETADGGMILGNQSYQVESPFGHDAVLDLKFSDNPPIAAHLIDFHAANQGSQRLLEWRCLSDQKTAGYLVERSEGATRTFRAVAPFIPVEAGMSSGEERLYRCIDSAVVQPGVLCYRLLRITLDGEKEILGESSLPIQGPAEVETLRLAVMPNPARGPLVFTAYLPNACEGNAAVYDLSGRLIRVLHSGSYSSGLWHHHWDGRDEYGHPLAAGVYLLTFNTGGKTRRLKFTLLP
ncbi:MAG: DUF4038 domain-containing protein [candidate division KSB1 bacterium]|nr:DUF4038 domain-containing protein [candidate division KSB1 bacterium]